MTNFAEIKKSEFAGLSANYFNSAYLGPLPKRTQAAGVQAVERMGDPAGFSHEHWRSLPDQARVKLGALLGAPADNISHHSSVSEVISCISLGFPIQGSVALMDGEYPSDILPWLVNEGRSGYKILKLKEECFRDVDLLRKSLPSDVKALNISHVMFNTGRRNDILAIGKLCQERGILFVLDVSQSLGGLPLTAAEVQVCDVIVGVTYKWLLGPYGHAFAYWSERALRDVAHVHLSWQTTASSAGDLLRYDIKPLPGARRFDRGQAPNFVGMSMLMKSLDLHLEATLAETAAHNRRLVSQFLEIFPKNKFQMITPAIDHANIVCLRPKNRDAKDFEAALRSESIDVSIREGNMRLSFHLFNTADEVEYLARALDSAPSIN